MCIRDSDAAKQGNIEPGKIIYQRFRERVIHRLETNIAWLKDDNHSFPFDTPQALVIDRENHPWHLNQQQADTFWQKMLTLNLLNLTLRGELDDDLKTTSSPREKLIRRYQNQLSSTLQHTSREVTDFYFNALTTLYDPHTEYFSPRQSENFEISMRLSLEGIGAVLQKQDEFTKVVNVVAGGPADTQTQLGAGDRIIAIGEGQNLSLIHI